MPSFKAPRGTRDILPAERATWSRLERTAADLAARYGYREIETPLIEQTEVFERGVGEVTDVVEKELFRIAPRTEEAESWSLRPEPTAGIVRAYVQHGMQTWPQPVKLTLDRADVPLRPAAGRVATASSGSSTSRRSAIPGRPSMRSWSSSACASTGTSGSTASRSCSTRSATPPAGPPSSPSSPATTAPTSTGSRRSSANGSSGTRSACSTRGNQRCRSSTRLRRRSRTCCARHVQRTSPTSGRISTRSA